MSVKITTPEQIKQRNEDKNNLAEIILEKNYQIFLVVNNSQ